MGDDEMTISGAARKVQFTLTRGVPEGERPAIFFGKRSEDHEWRGFAGWHTTVTWNVSDEDSMYMMFMADSRVPYVLIDRATGVYEAHNMQWETE